MPELRLRGGEVDGLDLHYIVAGRGPAVVLVHGLGGFAESWRHTTRALADRTTVYALDLPGFGASAKPPARYRLSYFASALHGFMEVLGIREASLVGHSLGAAAAVTYALTHPARVERLALVGASSRASAIVRRGSTASSPCRWSARRSRSAARRGPTRWRSRPASTGRYARRSTSSSTSGSLRGPPPPRARPTSPRSVTCGRISRATRRTTAGRSRPWTCPSC